VANENVDDEDEEDDWSFMNVRPKHKRSNGLFVDDDEDEMEEDLVITAEGLRNTLANETGEGSVSTGDVIASTDGVSASTVNPYTDNNISAASDVTVSTEATTQASLAPVPNISEESDDPFSDDDEIISASLKKTQEVSNEEVPNEEVPNEEDLEDDNDMELMREFG
jgi:hypothetical protein